MISRLLEKACCLASPMHGYIDPFLFTSKAFNHYYPPAIRITQADRILQQVNHPPAVIYLYTIDRINSPQVRDLQIGLCNQLIHSASRSEANLL